MKDFEIKKIGADYAVYYKGRRQTILIPDEKSAKIILKVFEKEFNTEAKRKKYLKKII